MGEHDVQEGVVDRARATITEAIPIVRSVLGRIGGNAVDPRLLGWIDGFLVGALEQLDGVRKLSSTDEPAAVAAAVRLAAIITEADRRNPRG